MCLMGDTSQLPNVSKKNITASRLLLRKWKTNVTPNVREWLDAMAETASYEALLHKLKGKEEDRVCKDCTRQTRN